MIPAEEVADFVVAKAKKDPKVRAIIEDVKAFEELVDHVGFQRMRAQIAELRKEILETIAHRLLNGEKVTPEMQTQIDFQRGYLAAAEDILTRPEKAGKSLEQAARMAWALAQREALSSEEDERPYL